MALTRKIHKPAPTPSRSAVESATFRALTSLLVDRARFANRAGITHANRVTGLYARDLFEALGYRRELTCRDYIDRYVRGGVAERIVEAYPRATWVSGVTIQEDPDPENTTAFEQAVSDLFDRLQLWQRFLRADILAGLGRYSVMLIGAPGVLSQPLQRASAKDVTYVSTLSEDRATIASYVEDTTNPAYGTPEFYNVQLLVSTTHRAHYTRVVHLAEGLLEDDVFGKPRLRAVWNYLDDLDKIVGGGAEAAWKRMDPGMQVDIGPDVRLTPEIEDDLDKQIDELIHGYRRVIRTRGAKIDMLSAAVAGFGPNASSVMDFVSATTGIPQRILMGSERGELASAQDKSNWDDRVAERRKEFAEPAVRRVVDMFIKIGVLPAVREYEIVWPKTDEMDEPTKAEVAASIASANASQRSAGDTPILSSSEIRDKVFGLDPLEVEETEEEETTPPAPASPEELEQEIGATEEELVAAIRAHSLDDIRAYFDRVDNPPSDPEWRTIHRVADMHQGRVARVFEALWAEARREIRSRATALEAAIARGSKARATSIAYAALHDAESAVLPRVHTRISEVFSDGGTTAYTRTKARGSWYEEAFVPSASIRAHAATFDFDFDTANPRAVSWSRYRAAQLVREVGRETKAALRQLISKGISEGIPPRRLVALIQQRVGLRSDQVKALYNFAARGASDSQVDRYAKKLLRDRALLIARTETMRAANAGQRELWLQARDSGDLPSYQQRTWLVTWDDRLRDEHEDMAEQVVGIDEPFVHPFTHREFEPGEDPNCRCGQGLVESKKRRR